MHQCVNPNVADQTANFYKVIETQVATEMSLAEINTSLREHVRKRTLSCIVQRFARGVVLERLQQKMRTHELGDQELVKRLIFLGLMNSADSELVQEMKQIRVRVGEQLQFTIDFPTLFLKLNDDELRRIYELTLDIDVGNNSSNLFELHKLIAFSSHEHNRVEILVSM